MKKLIIILAFIFGCTESNIEPQKPIELDSIPKLVVWLTTPCKVYLDVNGIEDSLNTFQQWLGIADTFNLNVGYNKVIFWDTDIVYQTKPLIWEFTVDYWQTKFYYYSCY